MTTRRDFLRNLTAIGAVAGSPKLLFSNPKSLTVASMQSGAKNKMWACLMHLSVNMWRAYYYDLQWNESLWNEALESMTAAGMDTVVIDLGDAVQYRSHPEIAVKGAWSTEKLQEELVKIRKMGLRPIPKLNFSTYHDSWLGPYSKMVSSDAYYQVCKDLIAEICYHFEKPDFFHLGMDEEYEPNHLTFDSISIRQNKQYWGDFYFLIGEVFKNGSRPWVWQDYIRKYPDEFAKMMPKSVLQSNWYNRNNFNPENNPSIKAYQTLNELGYEQVPGGSNYYEGTDENFMNNVKFCTKNISDEKLLGFIQSSWRFTTEENRTHILNAIELAGKAKKWYNEYTSSH
jgi:hypothetical protein|nr:twin-arginine translocation signal domain-containing protein [Proteiniphilum sp. UBA4988]